MAARKSARAETVDDYLAAAPDDARAALTGLRKTITAAAPEATEVISYQIPTYKHHGPLVAFAAHKDHCGLYVMSSDVMRAHAAELKDFELGKTTIRFPADNPLPAPLVTTLVKARIAENEGGGNS
ncbi:MAG: iron chaperone [Solirubrobacterales bacterium]